MIPDPRSVRGEDFWIDELEYQLGRPLTPTGRDYLRTWLRAFSANERRQAIKVAESHATALAAERDALRSAIFELAPHPSLWEALTNEQIVRTRLISVDAFNQSRDEATALREALNIIAHGFYARPDGAVEIAKAAISAPPAAQAETPLLKPIPQDWADAANSARGLCESEANKWETTSPATAAHWRSVAIRLGALYLTQDHLAQAETPAAKETEAGHERQG